MAQGWFIIRDGEVLGPFSARHLKEMAADGRLSPDDRVRRSDMQVSRKARDIKGLLFQSGPMETKSSAGQEGVSNASSLRSNLVDRWQALGKSGRIGVAAGAGTLAFMFLCCGGLTTIGFLVGSKDRGVGFTTGSHAGRATIKHDKYTQVIMPEFPPDRVHDKEEGEIERNIGEVAVPDIASVDFLSGPGGEPIEMVRHYEVSKLEGQPEIKMLRQIGYLYRNKAGKKVYHGPWCYLLDGDKSKKESETTYVHGKVKFSQSWDAKGHPLSLEFFKSDDDHTQMTYEYYDDGSYRFHGQFVKVRYVTNAKGHTVERVPDGMHFYYWEQTGKVRQEEVYENGKQSGIAIYDLAGNKVVGRGKLK